MTVNEAGVNEVIAEPVNVNALDADSNEVNEVSEKNDQVSNKESDQERNFKALREKQERLQREYEDERRRREEYEQVLLKIAQQQQHSNAPKEQEEQIDLQPDDWLTYDQFEKLSAKKTKSLIQQALEEDRKLRAEQDLPMRLRNQFQDFESVVTEDNVKQLKALEPEVAAALNKIDDKYAQAVAAYKYIKKLVPEAAEQTQFKERVEKNSKKPGSLSSVSSSSLSQAQGFERGLTPELKKQLYSEMLKASKAS